MKKIILLTTISLLAHTTGYAQIVGKVAPKAAKSFTNPKFLRYLPVEYATPGGNALMYLQQEVARTALRPSLNTPTLNTVSTHPPITKRSWLEQQKRNYQAWQLKHQRSLAQALQAQIAALPKLRPEEAFYTQTFEHLIPDGSTPPTSPFMVRPGYLYRGLGLHVDGEALKNILENGLLLQDAGAYSNNLVLSWASSPEDASLAASYKYTNLTKSPDTAFEYAKKNAKRSADNVLPVIVAVQGQAEYAYVVRVQHDIPPQNIPQVIALLQINGAPTWCRIESTENGFLVTPYERK